MAFDAIVYVVPENTRSRIVANAFQAGLIRSGFKVRIKKEKDYRGPEAPLAIFYGLHGHCRLAFKEYPAQGKNALYVDLGYWLRETPTTKYNFHKVVLNNRHPTSYFQKKNYPSIRFEKLNIKIQPWRKSGNHILLAGMGEKAADVENLVVESWEYSAVEQIRRFTDRPIVYRPKPSWKGARPIPGTIYSPKSEPLESVLANCHAVVTHHSNVAVDGLISGVPAFCWEGVAVPMALQDLSKIEEPYMPEGRFQWASNVAFTQWSPSEMHQGLPLLHMRQEGLI